MALGYLSAFDGANIVDGSTTKHRSMVAESDRVYSRVYVLPNGTKVNYDGTSDSDTHPGEARQQVVASGAGALAAANALIAKKGLYGTLTKTLQGGGSETCSAIMMGFNYMSNSVPSKNYYIFECSFDLITDWA